MNLGHILVVFVEVALIIDELRVVVQLGRETLTVEKGKLMILQLRLRRVCVH